MARINSIPEDEIAVGHRLLEARKALCISQTTFALKLEIGRERLASYESGRVPLPYHVGQHISMVFKISPLWLALGEGPKWVGNQDLYVFIDHPMGERRTFLEVIRMLYIEGREMHPELIEPEYFAAQKNRTPSGPFININDSVACETFISDCLYDVFVQIKPIHRKKFLKELQEKILEIGKRYSALPHLRKELRSGSDDSNHKKF